MQSHKPHVLVLGATGKVGGRTARLLAESGEVHVVAGVRSPDTATELAALGIEVRPLDLDRHETLAPALAGVERALLLTGYSVDMLQQSKAFLDAARVAGVQHIVHIGASGAATNGVPHWGWHQFVERYIEALGFEYTHLRPEAFMQNVTGPGYRWLEGDTLRHYVGNARWSWLDADDLALVAARVLSEPQQYRGRTIRLGYDARTFAEVAAVLSQVTGWAIRAEARPPEEFFEAAVRSDADPAYMRSVYTQFTLNAASAIPEADRTFDDFESITGRPPVTWPDFALRHKDILGELGQPW